MGTNAPHSQTTSADALFTRAQQRVLGILFGNSDRSFYAKEIIRAAAIGSGAVQRELKRLEASGLIVASNVGNQRHYQANRKSPVYRELHSLILKTSGAADVVREALAPLIRDIELAFIYGSVANGTDIATSDVDLFVVSDTLPYAEIYRSLSTAERRLGRQVNPTVYTQSEFQKRQKTEKAFVKRVLSRPRIWIVGSDDDVAA